MPDCTSCGDSFPFLIGEKCNGCAGLDNCETIDARQNLTEVREYIFDTHLFF